MSGGDRFTVVGAGSRVLGVGLADDVLLYLVPLVLIVTSVERDEEEGGGVSAKWPLVGPDGGVGTVRVGTTRTACVPATISSWRKGSSRGRCYQAAH